MFFYLEPDDMKAYRNKTGIREKKTLRNKINNEKEKWIGLKKKKEQQNLIFKHCDLCLFKLLSYIQNTLL